MSAGVRITRTDLTAAELRRAAGRIRDAKSARRMLAVALVLEGVDRKTAAQSCGMDRQTPAGLGAPLQCRGAGRACEPAGWSPAAAARRTAGRARVMGGGRPRPGAGSSGDGVVRCRRQDLRTRIAERFGVEVHERTVAKYLEQFPA
jgi:transposase